MSETTTAPRVKQRYRVRAGKGMTTDSFVNFAANIGYGTQNLTAGSQYQMSPISRNHYQLEMMYRGSWLVRQIVDSVAEDMTRAGVLIESDMPPDDEAALMEYWQGLQLWQDLQSTVKWSRLYGGAIGVIMIDGQDPETPLRLDSITLNQFKGLLVLDRWMVVPDLQNTVQALGPDFGLPRFYNVVSDAHSVPSMRVHYSRCIRFQGADLPYWQKMAENMWGLSVIEPMWDRMIAFDSATNGAAQLVYKAHLRTLSVERLRDIIAAGGKVYDSFLQQVGLIRLMQSNEGMTILDASDKFEAHQYSFSGLSDILVQFGQQLSGAAGIPLVRLFGQSPAGMNATGESDIRNYYDMINAQQEAKLRRPLKVLFEICCRSKFGKPLPEGFNFKFRPLWQLADQEKSTVAQGITTTVLSAFEQGVISQKTVLKELREQSTVTGVWGNITDEEIDRAEEDPPQPEMGMPGMPPGMGGPQPGEAEQGAPAPSGLPGQPGEAGEPRPGLQRPGNAQFASEATGGPVGRTRATPKPSLPRGALGDLVAEVGRRRARTSPQRRGGVPDLLNQVRRLVRRPLTSRERAIAVLRDQRSIVDVHGLICVIETPKGAARPGWNIPIAADYGYITQTGSAEGSAEQMDCFIGDRPDATRAYIIHQNNANGDFDEHKVMLGFADKRSAVDAYTRSYSDGQEARIAKVETMSVPQLKRWLRVWEYALPNTTDRRRAMNGRHV